MPQVPLKESYPRKLDKKKNRFKLPFEWVAPVSEVGRLIATIMDGTLTFYMPEAWERIAPSLRSSSKPEDVRAYDLACEVRIQKNGKLSIPKKLASRLALGDRIELVGEGSRFVVRSVGRPTQKEVDLFTPKKLGSVDICQIPIDSIEFDGDTARIEEAKLDEGVRGSDALDVFPPLLVMETETRGRYRLLWGLKHLLAQRRLKRKLVAAIVLDLDREGESGRSLVYALEQLSKVPDSQMVRLVETMRNNGIKPTMIAKILDKTVRTVQRYLVVARAPDHIRTAFEEGELSLSLAYEAAKKGLSPLELKGKTFKKAKEMIDERGLAKAPCNMKGHRFLRSEIHPNGNVNLVLGFRVDRHDPEVVLAEFERVYKRVVEHLKKMKGVSHEALGEER